MIERYRDAAGEIPKSGQNKVSVKVVLAKEMSKKYNPENENDKSDGEGIEEMDDKDQCLPQFLLPDEVTYAEPTTNRLFEIERPMQYMHSMPSNVGMQQN